jgi:hypothetical protein
MPDQGDEQAPFAFTRGQLAEAHKKASDYFGKAAADKVDAAVSQSERRQLYVARAWEYRYARFDPLRAQMESQRCRVECCWLTSAMRSTGNARACSEVANDASVRLLDLPRQIVPEMHL